jgi:cyclic beta-1,2-glucan synthetase
MAQAQAQRMGLPEPQTPQPTRGDLAYTYFTGLSSAHRASHPQWGQTYGLEPYAIAGDVYSHAPYAGRGGWSWYTGAAGWLHQAAIRSIFGLDLQANTLKFRPCMPAHWNQATLTLTRNAVQLHFRLVRPTASEPLPALLPGEVLMSLGQELAWQALPDNSRYAMALTD